MAGVVWGQGIELHAPCLQDMQYWTNTVITDRGFGSGEARMEWQ